LDVCLGDIMLAVVSLGPDMNSIFDPAFILGAVSRFRRCDPRSGYYLLEWSRFRMQVKIIKMGSMSGSQFPLLHETGAHSQIEDLRTVV